MKRLFILFLAGVFVFGAAAKQACAVTIGLPIEEVRQFIDVSSVDVAVKKGHAKVINKIDVTTKGGKWAIKQAKKLGVKMTGKTVVYEIDAIEAVQDIAGVDFPVWAFVPRDAGKGFKNPHGPIPGPTVIANKGDFVRILFRNLSQNRHTIHIHGPVVIHSSHDGTSNIAQLPVKIDHEYTYEFVAWPSGTHIYHCHVNANEHMDMGLRGGIIIHDPKDEKVDQDRLCILDEWDSRFSMEEGYTPTRSGSKQSADVGNPRNIANMNFFTMNGNAWTDEYPNVVLAQQGQKIRVRFINFGSWPHNIHLHGHTLHWVAWDGRNVYPYNNKISDKDMRSDSVAILPGERKDYILIANQEGRWVWHCHSVPMATNDGVYHGGLLAAIVYLGKGADGKLYPKGIDLDEYPLGKSVPIGHKPFDALK